MSTQVARAARRAVRGATKGAEGAAGDAWRSAAPAAPHAPASDQSARPAPADATRQGRSAEVLAAAVGAAVLRGGDEAVARAIAEGRRVLLWIRQSTERQVREHTGSREEQFAQLRYLAPYGVTSQADPRVTVLDAGGETARRAADDGDDVAEGQAVAPAARRAGPRPNYGRLRDHLKSGAFGVLSLVTLDRAARNDKDVGEFIHLCRKHRVLILEGGRLWDVRRQDHLLAVRCKLMIATTASEAQHE